MKGFCGGTTSHAKHIIGCSDRLGERELALCRCALRPRFSVDPNQHIDFPWCCDFGPAVCGRLRILDLLSARPAVADVDHDPKNAGSDRSRGPDGSGDARQSGHATPSATFFVAGQLAVGTTSQHFNSGGSRYSSFEPFRRWQGVDCGAARLTIRLQLARLQLPRNRRRPRGHLGNPNRTASTRTGAHRHRGRRNPIQAKLPLSVHRGRLV